MSRGGEAAGRLLAVVIGRWAGDTALLRTEDGRTVEATVPEALRDDFDVGARVRLDPAGDRIVGWSPPETG
ncbi:MAG: hypothetical protein M3340_07760 [Actinomycetota bacterium]|nr:hypothetical protein [Actinomycetota bacterium]